MAQHLKPKFKYVRRADGTLLTPGSLPPANTQRWVMRRKADIVMAVRGGLLTMEAACARYRLSLEEFLAWQNAFEHFGMRGLSSRGGQEMQKIRHADNAEDHRLQAQSNGGNPAAMPMDTRHYRRPKLVHSR